jgi:tetratricopeptide (TPR) repeat protein
MFEKLKLIALLLGLGFFIAESPRALAQHEDPSLLAQQSDELYKEGKYKEAIPIAEKLLVIRKKELGPEHLDTAESLGNLAFLYNAMGDPARAEPLYKEALEIRQKILGREHPDTATTLNNLGLLYEAIREYSKAEPLLKEALETRQKVLGREHAQTVTSLNSLATLYHDMGDYANAEPLLKEALEIRQKMLGPEHPDTVNSLNNLGWLYRDLGEYAKAEPLLQEALRIRQKVLGFEHPDTAFSLNSLASLYKVMGEYGKAEPLFQEALRIYRKVLGPEHPDAALTLNNLAALYEDMGECAKAEPLLKEALRIDQKVLGSRHPDTAGCIENLATLYFITGDYTQAEQLFKEALEICRKALGNEHLATAPYLNGLAVFYQSLGEYAWAEPLLKEALQIREKVLGPDHPDTAASLSSLAGLYEQLGDYAKAELLLKESLRIDQKMLGPENPDTVNSLNDLAYCYWAKGDYTKTEQLFEEALGTTLKTFGSEHFATAGTLFHLARLYAAAGEYVKAEPLFKEALRIDQKVLGREHPATATALRNLALLELDVGNIQEAKRTALLVYAADLKTFAQILSFGSEDQRLTYQSLQNPYLLFAAVGESDTQLAGAVLHYKGVVLDSIIEDRLLAETSKEEANWEQVEELKTKKRALAQLMLQASASAPSEATQRIQALEQDVEGLQDKLARQLNVIGQARRAITVTVEQLQAAIPKNTVLVEYVRYDHYLGRSTYEWRYGAVVLSANVPPRWVTLGNAQDIEGSLHRYQRLVRTASDDDMAAILQKVYKEVWEPVEGALQANVDAVIVSPDGQLNFLSFATLLDPDNRFLAQKYSIRYVASGRDLLRELQPTQSKQVIVMSNPQFAEDLGVNTRIAKDKLPAEGSGMLRGAEKRDVEDLSFEQLEGTQKESAQLLLLFKQWGWQGTSLTGADVSKRALRDLHSPYILHLATHGFFEPDDPTSGGNPNESKPPGIKLDLSKSRFFKNPMHRSGLALAGANSTIEAWKHGEAPPIEEDGILTAEDVSTLDLKGTWLVTLSACDTGSGEARAGEGVMGLRRGFVEAGAQNLLMTLWPISDEVTAQIMSDFYETAHNTGNAPEALAEVQREWLVQLRDGKGPKFDKVKDAINERGGLTKAVNLAGAFIMSSQGKP